ncbi:antibiotic biosynthesis monooxygenase [Paraflavitalea sp. CAU 1676]|uniref:putative quinol monooxygenase n=1 Tax=Paraflavitalea sp. CAU 1676 TaxID=3032598 RepID=UPI0023DB55E8|nr:antibiotic biosynthesis monooxygenase [Paraflavitalea sp. CAU 1676]MDF2187930.1 antibiotic biosynthesis monooxygenase [Paraflavitalea sp. CAU 1676]
MHSNYFPLKSSTGRWIAALSFLVELIKAPLCSLATSDFGSPSSEQYKTDLVQEDTGNHGLRDYQASVRLIQYNVKQAYQEVFWEALTRYVFSSLKTPGNIMSEAYYEEGDSTTLWIIERWDNNQTLQKNEESPVARHIKALAKEGLESPAQTYLVADLEPLPDEAYRRTPAAHDHPLTIMLFVDTKKGTEDTFKKLYHAAMPAFRDEPGVITYQLCQSIADKTKFITYEKFRSEEAFREHLKESAVEPVLQFLQTSITAPPFEKGLHRLIELAPLHRSY